MTDFLRRFIEDFAAEGEIPAPPGDAPEMPVQRGLRLAPSLEDTAIDFSNVEEAREILVEEMRNYADIRNPDHVLLFNIPPGVGKSYAGVQFLEHCIRERNMSRVFYAGPRHDLYPSLVRMSKYPELWYEWLPRQLADADGKNQTCVFAPHIQTWVNRGHEGIKYCEKWCSWGYIKNECSYYAQQHKPQKIFYGMHNHVFGAHPLSFDLLIGDESPLSVVTNQWIIPQEYILPAKADAFDYSPRTNLLRDIRRLAIEGKTYKGRALIEALGGAEALSQILMEIGTVKPVPPDMNRPDSANHVAYGFLPDLIHLLRRELQAYVSHGEYICRIIISGGRLMLLLRREINGEMPKHVIWMNGTSDHHLDEALFNRKVRTVHLRVKSKGKIFQFWDRAYGKTSLIKSDGEETEITNKVRQVRMLVNKIVEQKGYKNPGVFSYKALEPYFEGYHVGHFGAETGTNDFEGVDALFVIGTPLPSLFDMENMAAMIFQQRMTPFRATWSMKEMEYIGKDAHYPVGGYWGDPDLQSVVSQLRNAKIVQAAHRARPNIRDDVDVYLLTNIPLVDLPPDELVSVRSLFGVPDGVNSYNWIELLDLSEKLYLEMGYVSAEDIQARMEVSDKTARKYLDTLLTLPDWEVHKVAVKRGRPPKMAKRREQHD